MLDGLGDLAEGTAEDQWPHFLFLGGDQIYADEIGWNAPAQADRGTLRRARARSCRSAGTLRDKLVDGAWAGRFAHRFQAYKDARSEVRRHVTNGLEKLDGLRKRSPGIWRDLRRYPGCRSTGRRLQTRHDTLEDRRKDVQRRADEHGRRRAAGRLRR